MARKWSASFSAGKQTRGREVRRCRSSPCVGGVLLYKIFQRNGYTRGMIKDPRNKKPKLLTENEKNYLELQEKIILVPMFAVIYLLLGGIAIGMVWFIVRYLGNLMAL